MKIRKLILIAIDFLIVSFVTLGIMLIYPQLANNDGINSAFFVKTAILAAILIIIRYAFRIYDSVIRYANIYFYTILLLSDFVGFVVFTTLEHFVPYTDFGLAFTVVSIMAIVLITLVSRFVYQLYYAYVNNRKERIDFKSKKQKKIKIAIVGAGNVGATLANELLRNPRALYYPICFVDIDRQKIGKTLNGIQILSEDEKLFDSFERLGVDEIVIAITDTNKKTSAALYENYRKSGLKVKLYDYIQDAPGTAESTHIIRDFDLEELLCRRTINVNSKESKSFYSGKTVLVTGGGGSIGSEICRQVAKCSPKELIILDIYENNAYDIQQELIYKFGDKLNLTVLIASVRDADRIDSIFEKYRPDIVFHAAAHKHVPLMENSPMEAIKNNVFGTYITANAAEKYGAEKFILISTDKAVNPTNIMGATKRLCEMVVQCRHCSNTEFAAVRFGNVLGSNGSVIPLFKKQILAGGPLTLTDKRIIRYIMTIPEAVGLVMEAGAFAQGGELYVLDMGEPVKILSLAEKTIQLMGFEPYKDIDIVEIGLRKGEKLYEELLIRTEELDKTENDLIFIERDEPYTRSEIEAKLNLLRKAMLKNDNDAAFDVIRSQVPTYKSPEELNNAVEKVHSEKYSSV